MYLPLIFMDVLATAASPTEIATSEISTLEPNTAGTVTTIVAASISSAAGLILIVGVMVVLAVLLFKYKSRTSSGFNNTKEVIIKLEQSSDPSHTSGSVRYVQPVSGIGGDTLLHPMERARVNSGFIRNMSELNLLIPGRHIQLLDSIGQGEFGVVYKGRLTGWNDRTTAEVVAVKTLRNNLFSKKDIEDLMKESEKMVKFKHLHVLNLIGVCIDSGKAPYIVMPFMANGSLLVYLRKEKPNLSIAKEAGEEMIGDAKRKLLSICLQISQGMCYLAEQNFVHRDLAARNCMISQDFVIKVADFGLSEDIYCRNYFRQDQTNEEDKSVKLPIRWMALESLLENIFTEKTDVWSYGVTCWEVFTLGLTPYPAVNPFSLIKFLKEGGRLEKPTNAACTDNVYELINHCWVESPEKRYSFEYITKSLNCLLEDVAGYMDLSAINSASGTTGYDHLARYDHLTQ